MVFSTKRLLVTAATIALTAATLPLSHAGAQPEPDTCAGLEVTIPGSDTDDVLRGTPGDDVIDAGAGDDTVIGGGGNDVICGGPGIDVLRGGRGDDVLLGQGGADSAFGGAGDDRIDGGPGGDLLVGRSGNDVLNGRRGADAVRGGVGDDTLRGGPAWDDCRPGSGMDTRVRCEQVIVTGSDAPLVGARLGTRPRPAISRLLSVLGPPTADTGWAVGCELDDPSAINERRIAWGSLSANFYGAPGDRSFTGWDYLIFDDGARAGGPTTGDVFLPGAVAVGDPLQDAADALGVEIETGLLDFGLRVIAPGGGLQISTQSDVASGPISEVRVGDFFICD